MKILLSWSGGKDGALALAALRRDGRYEIAGLITVFTREYGRVSMHGVRRELAAAQARSAGLPLLEVHLDAMADNGAYEKAMGDLLLEQKSRGVRGVAFGDLHLADVRAYREERLGGIGMEAVFPLWEARPEALMEEFLEGFGSVVTCVDTHRLDGAFAGRLMDRPFFESLPSGIDPFGENGEYHSFAYRAPFFRADIPFTRGERVMRDDRFLFCDLLPGSGSPLFD